MSNDSATTHTDRRYATIEWDTEGQPYSPGFGDIYFSKHSGIEESRYVFIQHNQLPERWQQLAQQFENGKQAKGKQTFTIAETGFGTGLNFLAAWDTWNQHASKEALLHFISVEKYPLLGQDLAQALKLFKELAPLAEKLIDAYPPQPVNGIQRLVFDEGRVILSLYIGEAAEGFRHFSPDTIIANRFSENPPLELTLGGPKPCVDAWFLDGFAPAKNPAMWTPELFQLISGMSRPGTTFSTFTAASLVRKLLSANGFECRKVKGFARKREQLIGTFTGAISSTSLDHAPQAAPTNDEASAPSNTLNKDPNSEPFRLNQADTATLIRQAWHLCEPSPFAQSDSIKTNHGDVNEAIVIGGGLAGCHTAHALARRGINTAVIERHNRLATQASGNTQGVVYTKLSDDNNPLCRFNIQAQIFANHFYETFDLFNLCGGQSGVLHIPSNEREAEQYQRLGQQFKHSSQFARWLDMKEAADISGLAHSKAGLFVEKAGWLNPIKTAHRLCELNNITVQLNTDIDQLAYENDLWHLIDHGGKTLYTCKILVIANAYDAMHFTQTQHLPLKRIRGQVTHIKATEASRKLKTTLCGKGYISPLSTEMDSHCIGASFTMKDFSSEMTYQEQIQNIDNISSMVPSLLSEFAHYRSENNPLVGKTGFRCTTPDYFPLIGPVAHKEQIIEQYADLRKNAKKVILQPGNYHPNLYCNIGHGSRGLAYTPLCAESLASIITGQHLPIDLDLFLHMHATRFLIRDLIRNKI